MRILAPAFVLSVGTVAFLALAVPRIHTGYSEREVRRELQAATPGDTLDSEVRNALDAGDIAGAQQYAGLAQELRKPIAPETAEALADAQSTLATMVRNAGDFAGAYITGRADSAAGLAGAVVSDLTVVGDVRDIISEGGKAAIGEEYSRFLLTLAAVGLAAEGASVATGGSSLVVKVALSVLKVAKRTGNVTIEFSQRLVRLARTAAQNVDLAAVTARAGRTPAGAVDAARTTGVTRTGAAGDLSHIAARAELRSTLGSIATVAETAGPAEAVRLLRTVRTSANAQDLATFSSRFGRRARAVAELTGKTAMRGFRVVLRGARLLVAFLWSMLAWIVGLTFIRVGKRILGFVFGLFRNVFVAVALP